jgi:hypothetical protein
MNLTRTGWAAVLLGGMAFGAMCGSLPAQTWQPKWQQADSGTTSSDWDQRVLKQATPSQPSTSQWSAGGYSQPVGSYQVAQRPSYDGNSFGTVSMPAEPGVTTSPSPRGGPAGAEPIPTPGPMQFEPMAQDGAFAGGGCPNCGGPGGCDSCEACGSCDQCGGPGCGQGCDFGWEVFDGHCGNVLRGLSVFAGVDGFKGLLDHGTNGDFGFNEGVNIARPLGDPWGCGYQLGVNFVQSDFSGAPPITVNNVTYNADFRRQYFATAAIFNRALCGGLQWGVAYDYYQDNFYQTINLQQIRTEIGWVCDSCNEIGYYGAYGVNSYQGIEGKLIPTDMFLIYGRHTFENGGEGRIWGGVTGEGDGLLGANLWVPLGRGFALENRIMYLIPKQGTGTTAEPRESWGLVAQLVWYPGQNASCQQHNPYRAMFNVADNSLFMVDRIAH